jgi:large subunit ribosomal protein L35
LASRLPLLTQGGARGGCRKEFNRESELAPDTCREERLPKVKLKLKTHKGAAKRFKFTATGKVMRGHSGARHILTSKPRKRKRKLGQTTTVDPADVRHVRAMLPYGR